MDIPPDFSRRLDWTSTPNALAAAESARRRSGLPILDLTESNPTTVGLPLHDGSDALSSPRARTLSAAYAPRPFGDPAARAAIAESYRASGCAIDPERVVLTVSSSESYSLLWKLLCDPGDAILVPEPSYPLFDYLARLEGVATVPYRLAHDGTALASWQVDLASVDEALRGCRRHPRALVIVSPNNPTGSVLRRDELAALDARAAAAGLALVFDEVFADYVHRPPPAHARSLAAGAAPDGRALTFTLGGLSKGGAMPHMKVGWLVVGGPAAVAEQALARLDLVCDTYLSVSSPAQGALPELLRLGAANRAAVIERLARNRERLARVIGEGSALTLLASEGGWSAILRLPAVATDERWALALLQEDGVLVAPGYFFDLRDATFLVVSLLPEPAVFDEGIRRLVARVDSGWSAP